MCPLTSDDGNVALRAEKFPIEIGWRIARLARVLAFMSSGLAYAVPVDNPSILVVALHSDAVDLPSTV